MSTSKYAILAIILCTIITASGQLLLKLGANNLKLDLTLINNYYLLLGIVAYVIGAGILIISLKYGELSVLYPFYSLSFIWVTIVSIYQLNEQISILKIIAIIFIILGVSLIGKGSKKWEQTYSPS
jgi:drug/metabolite transporter (DMT)-like permease